jgi:hypothetical protein
MAYEDIIRNPGGAVSTTVTTTALPVYPMGIQPASGYYGTEWPASSGAIPQSFSAGGWTVDARGFAQQTFLGASVRSFTMNGGFGDSSSSLSVELINDEFNVSDRTPIGQGDDVYHNGQYDKFVPPIAGSPVFFKFGQNFATVSEAYKQTFDDLYSLNTRGAEVPTMGGGTYDRNNFRTLSNGQYVDLKDNTIKDYSQKLSGIDRGRDHLVFGGILQTYTQNRGPGGNPLYSVQVIDPREILSNVTVILNNYSGSIYNQNNLINVYGFLEFNPSQDTEDEIKEQFPFKSILRKVVAENGTFTFEGNDTWKTEENNDNGPEISASSFGPSFPVTGTGFSRRGPQGIPFYRVKQAINAIMGYQGTMPQEYIDKAFGGVINFRGFNYVVDFGTLPSLPSMYYLDFDQVNLLELAMEICDVTSRELFVTLLPVIDHPACGFLTAWNRVNGNDPKKLIAGIIRIDTIDRSIQPSYGAIKLYIDSLATSGIYVENQDVGYELSNIITDKFVVGAQEVEMYYFSTNADRDELDALGRQNGQAENTPVGGQWRLESSLEQQVLPYYGMLGKHAVTIPKGFGAYQQILLDTNGLNANGVGAYYVATEMELRCAAVSYDRWKEFLKIYNDTYIESLEMDDAEQTAGLIKAEAPPNSPPVEISNSYAVTVPRSLFDTYALKDYGDDDLPFSPCNPPYGYPLYYKRMTKLGIPEGGLTDIQTRYTTVLTNFAELKSTDQKNFKAVLETQFKRLKEIKESTATGLSPFEEEYFNSLQALMNNPTPQKITETVALVERSITNNKDVFAVFPRIAKKNTENAMRVYNFLKNVADDCLGKKFLVKIPKKVNLNYDTKITLENSVEYSSGPFGFQPRAINNIPGYEFSREFKEQVQADADIDSDKNMIKAFLNSGIVDAQSKYAGSLEINYNPISEQYESNYTPLDLGGFFEFDLFQNVLSQQNLNNIIAENFNNAPLGIRQCLIPQDLTNFINEQGRVSPYVRFDHSQFLSLDGISANDLTQQVKIGNAMIPDLCEGLDNVNGDEWHSFPDLEKDKDDPDKKDLPEQIAFIKCTVSEQLFMPPKTEKRSIYVHAGEYKDILRKTLPQKIYLPEEDRYVDSFTYYRPHYVPLAGRTGDVELIDFKRTKNTILNSYIIDTELDQLDTENVYALITLPSKVIPTKDARFRDGPFQQMNAERFKHFMTMDTVNIPEFRTPVVPPKPFPKGNGDYRDKLSDDQKVQAWMAAKKAVDSLNFAFPNRINVTSPSPVYPNLVVLPLMSRDRCYGPWVSSQLDGQANVYKNIGGRVEFIKDENLSPWNYAGYQLMNEAGSLQAQFSNSMLLFSERGGFVVPGLPPGNSLGKALLNGGPLVTNVDVSISEGGVQTTIKMDLYTSSFGKLQKQKQDQISKISRERQRLRDERNALIRKGLGKAATSFNYGTMYDTLRSVNPENVQQFANPMGNIVASVKKFTEKRISTQMGGANASPDKLFGAGEPSWTPHDATDYMVQGSLQDNSQIGRVAQNFLTEDSLAREYYNTASSAICGGGPNDLFVPVSKGPHSTMVSKPIPFIKSKSKYYVAPENAETFDDSDVTRYGD